MSKRIKLKLKPKIPHHVNKASKTKIREKSKSNNSPKQLDKWIKLVAKSKAELESILLWLRLYRAYYLKKNHNRLGRVINYKCDGQNCTYELRIN